MKTLLLVSMLLSACGSEEAQQAVAALEATPTPTVAKVTPTATPTAAPISAEQSVTNNTTVNEVTEVSAKDATIVENTVVSEPVGVTPTATPTAAAYPFFWGQNFLVGSWGLPGIIPCQGVQVDGVQDGYVIVGIYANVPSADWVTVVTMMGTGYVLSDAQSQLQAQEATGRYGALHILQMHVGLTNSVPSCFVEL